MNNLPLSDDERNKLAVLGAADAQMLVEMFQASPDAFRKYLGPARSLEIIQMLRGSLTPADRRVLEGAPLARYATGAMVGDPAPALRQPAYDLAKRDRLFEELQVLRRAGDRSPEARRRAAEVERDLSALLGDG